jgi:cell division protein ZapE
MPNLLDLYQQTLTKKGYHADHAQLSAISALAKLADQIKLHQQATQTKPNLWQKVQSLFHTKPKLDRHNHKQGLYLWGGVGRGKSFVMDLFFQTVPVEQKIRIHFHEFMMSTHAELKQLRGHTDPIEVLASQIAHKYRLICFDEFHVSDIADAMILQNVLRALLDRGVWFVMTSNDEPSRLYLHGLHRERFLPTIELLQTTFDILNLDAGQDYRGLAMDEVVSYHHPINEQTTQQLQTIFNRLEVGTVEKDGELIIRDRPLKFKQRADGVIWCDFKALCGQPRSHEDYLELINLAHTLIVSNIPKMSPQAAFIARRFTWLVDVCYDHSVKLIVQAQCPMHELYVEGITAREFLRTVSRLTEMNSQAYLHQPKRSSIAAL